MKYIKSIAASIILLGFSSLASATTCASKSSTSLDYGNATGQEASACHSSNYWQRLGTESTRGDDGVEQNASDNDGVSWKTSSDGGTTWDDNGELTSGGLVQFQFDVTRATSGNHKYDQLKSWVDWNQDGSWTEDETIISEKWYKDKDSQTDTTSQLYSDLNNVDRNWDRWGNYDSGNTEGSYNWDLRKWNSDVTTQTFFSSIITLDILTPLTEIWLRARVVCENSLDNHTNDMILLATGFHDQGEVEDYKLTVAKALKPITSVPEPSTLLIFTIALLGFTARRK